MTSPYVHAEEGIARVRDFTKGCPHSVLERKNRINARSRGVYLQLSDITNYARLHQVGASIPTIRLMYELGVRYITLTHTCDNPFATSCTTVAQGGEDHGLTAIGHEAVREMNRLGNSKINGQAV